MIAIKNISKKFGKLQVLDDVNLKLHNGECIALLGPNGCGKTTLIKTILGMVMPDKGSIMVNGLSIHNNVDYRNYIGYMPQIGRYPSNMTIGQIFDMIINIRNSKNTLDEQLYREFELNKILGKSMSALSGGTTQKVSAALAFLFNPDILILDEPTSGLDVLSAEILKEKIISEKQNGKLIILTSHLLSELDDLVSEVVFMQEGKIEFHQSVSELLSYEDTNKISSAIVQVLKNQVAV